MSASPRDKTICRTIEFDDNRLMIELCGQLDSNLLRIEQSSNVSMTRRGNQIEIDGEVEECEFALNILRQLYSELEKGRSIETGDIEAALKMPINFFEEKPDQEDQIFSVDKANLSKAHEIVTRKKRILPRTIMQKQYVRHLITKDITFGVGPAGTGKTYLAVAIAVSLYLSGTVEKIVLTRPAVEAGERLGFLPGDMKEKIDPYMQPLYDSLRDCLPERQISKMMESKLIEIAPLAFMRGRTLNNAFAVLDEAQNATAIQMKMFLTRLGQNSRMAITGDISQIDLPPGVNSGLIEVLKVLKNVKGVSFAHFSSDDVVRHEVVTRVIKAYEKYFKSK
ncbi:MAG: PhoH family protein [Pseudomonadota bacterium]|nr:PhoH family protein [Pseudomonadota bacterium]